MNPEDLQANPNKTLPGNREHDCDPRQGFSPTLVVPWDPNIGRSSEPPAGAAYAHLGSSGGASERFFIRRKSKISRNQNIEEIKIFKEIKITRKSKLTRKSKYRGNP